MRRPADVDRPLTAPAGRWPAVDHLAAVGSSTAVYSFLRAS